MTPRQHRQAPRRRQGGAIAIIVGLTLAVLIGFVGLAVDLGKLYITKTELQNATDACALAAARELTGTNANQLDIAEAAGITTASANSVMFQSEPVSVVVDEGVTFSKTLPGPYANKSAFAPAEVADLRYARCTASRGGIVNWFIQVLNVIPGVAIGNQTVASTAVATLAPAQTTCAIPVSVCSAALKNADGTTKPVGTWLEGAMGPGGNGMTGNFKWIDFTPEAGGGASELGGLLKGSGTCSLPSVGSEVGQAGVISSLSDEWNSRFGVYKGSTKVEEVIPDFTGFAYTEVNWPTKANAYDDFTARRAANAALQNNSETGLKIMGSVLTSADLKSNGSDRRLNIVPVVDCDDFASGTTAPVKSWACILMLHPINGSAGGGGGGGGGSGTGQTRMFLEYRGASNDPTSPCASLGLPGNGSVGPMVPVLVQ